MNCNPCQPIGDPCVPDPCIDPCLGGNPIQLDASAVFYHKDGCSPSQLNCLSLPNGIGIDKVLEAVDFKLCQVTNTYNYALYSLSYLRSRYTVTQHQEFVQATDQELFRQNTVIDNNYIALSNRITGVSDTIKGILYPRVVNSCNLPFNDLSTINRVIQVLSDKVCALSGNIAGGQAVSNASIDSASIAWSLAGDSNEVLQAGVRISAAGGNRILVNPDGIYVADPPFVSQLQSLSWNAVTRELSLSADGKVTIEAAVPQTLSFNCNTHILSLSGGGGPPVDLTCLVPPDFQQTSISIVPSSTIVFATSGIANHTLYAEVIIDPLPGNALSKSTSGLFVPSVIPVALTSTDSPTIAFTLSGEDNHNVSANLIIDPTAGNAIVVNSQGLFVPVTAETPNSNLESDTATVSLAGTLLRQICVNVKIDPDSNNRIISSPSGLLVMAQAVGVMHLPVVAAPATPVDGDMWREDNTNAGVKIRIAGVTKTVTVS